MAEYIDALPAGSYVAISHFIDPETSELPEIEGMLAGLELLDPGLVLCADWWPDGPRIKPLDTVQNCIVGAVARKP
jgi:hypothetical protein